MCTTWRRLQIFAFLAFPAASIWLYSICNELVEVLQTLGRLFGLSDVILGITVLAWGGSIGGAFPAPTAARARSAAAASPVGPPRVIFEPRWCARPCRLGFQPDHGAPWLPTNGGDGVLCRAASEYVARTGRAPADARRPCV